MKPITQAWHARCFGYLLDFCWRQGLLDRQAEPAAHVTPHIIDGFLDELKDRVRSVTRLIYMQRIRRVAEILAPGRDLAWLRDIASELTFEARPRPKHPRLVDASLLWTLGLNLMERAEGSTGRTELQRAILFREGLMIALLTVCPIRLKNFAGLRVGQHVRCIEGVWWIILQAQETKTKRVDERPLPETLAVYVDRWLTHWRPHFHQSGDMFWPSIKGGGLAYTYVGTLISRITRRELGVAINPHLFRDSDVQTIALRAGSEMGLASALLQHSDPRTTEKHYNKGASIEASRQYRKIVARLRG